MGWGNCGVDSNGRPIGYVFEATCDAPDCQKVIDRGLGYACGGMHGTEVLGTDYDIESCEGYFCEEHLSSVCVEHEDETVYEPACVLCIPCTARIEAEYIADEDAWLSKAPIV